MTLSDKERGYVMQQRYVSVQYQKKNTTDDYSGQEYIYIDGLGLMVNDQVIAPTAKGSRIAKVSRVWIPEREIDGHILPFIKTIDTLYTPDEKGAVDSE